MKSTSRHGLAAAAAVAVAALVPAGGSATAKAPPAATGQPRITGVVVEGRTLTSNNGAFSGSGPFNYKYSWLRCPASGSGGNGEGCTAISGATFKRYRLRSADVGHRLRVRVTAANSEGSATETSNQTATVLSAAAGGAPRNTSAPSVAGTTQVGQTLTANVGAWVGLAPVTFSYHWRRCSNTGAGCADITAATAKTYILTAADEGLTLRVRVTGRNARGSSSSTSAPTSVIGKAEAPSGATVAISDVSLPNRLLIDRVAFSPQPLRSRRTITARFHVSDSRSHSVQGALVFVVAIPFGSATTPAEATTGSDGWVTFHMRPTRRVTFGHPGGIVMFVRARKAGERLIGGVSTRRLVQLSTR